MKRRKFIYKKNFTFWYAKHTPLGSSISFFVRCVFFQTVIWSIQICIESFEEKNT